MDETAGTWSGMSVGRGNSRILAKPSFWPCGAAWGRPASSKRASHGKLQMWGAGVVAARGKGRPPMEAEARILPRDLGTEGRSQQSQKVKHRNASGARPCLSQLPPPHGRTHALRPGCRPSFPPPYSNPQGSLDWRSPPWRKSPHPQGFLLCVRKSIGPGSLESGACLGPMATPEPKHGTQGEAEMGSPLAPSD